MTLPRTPSQTVGPFFSFGLCVLPQSELLAADDEAAVRIYGSVLDGAGNPVADAMVEVWQPAGRPGAGWARSGTDAAGGYSFVVARPQAPNGEAAHLDVLVFARGLLKPVMTRMYVSGNAENEADPVLSALPAERAQTMVAVAEGGALRFDIHLQGDRETVFFDV
jgi:protocatechuate 3,4-dioxygenase, alpha subunit